VIKVPPSGGRILHLKKMANKSYHLVVSKEYWQYLFPKNSQ